MKTGFYLMAPIVPYCGPVRVPATLKEILPNGRLLLSDDTMRRCGSEYLIETDADCFQPANKPDVALSTGRIVRHTLMANGATNAEILGGPEMTEPEWQEYVWKLLASEGCKVSR